MALLVVGINPRRSAFYSLRERLSGESVRRGVLRGVAAHRDLSEALLLVGDGRIELYAVAREGCDALAAGSELFSGLAAPSDLAAAFYFAEEEDAASHLFAALCGLDEFGGGEPPEGLGGSLRSAIAEARQAGCLGKRLESLSSVASRLCAALSLEGQGASAPTLAGTAVELARRVFGHLDRSCVFLSGDAELPLAIGEALAQAGAGSFLLAEGSGAPMFIGDGFDTAGDIRAVVAAADIVVLDDERTCAAFGQLKVREVARLRRGRPTLLLDCGLGEGLVDRKVSSIDGVFLYTAADLAAIAKDVFSGTRSPEELGERLISQAMQRLPSAAD